MNIRAKPREEAVQSLRRALAIPAINKQKQLSHSVSVHKTDTKQLYQLTVEMNKVWQPLEVHCNSRSTEQLPTEQVCRAKGLFERYHGYLERHPAERVIFTAPFSIVKISDKHSSAANHKHSHYEAQLFCFYYQHYNLAISLQRKKIRQDFSQLKQASQPDEAHKLINQLCSEIEKLQVDYVECIAYSVQSSICLKSTGDADLTGKSEDLLNAACRLSESWEYMLYIFTFAQSIVYINPIDIEQLREVIFNGAYFANKEVLSIAYLHSQVETLDKTRQRINCITLITAKDRIADHLLQLDYFDTDCEIPNQLLELTFQTLVSALQSELKSLNDKSISGTFPVFFAVMNSYRNGWLSRHHSEILLLFSGCLPQRLNLLQLITENKSTIDEKVETNKKCAEDLYQKGLKFLEQKKTVNVKSQVSKSISYRKSKTEKKEVKPTYQGSKSETKEFKPTYQDSQSEKTREIDNMLAPIEAMVLSTPSKAIQKFQDILKIHTLSPKHYIRARIGIAHASIFDVNQTLRKFGQIRTDASTFIKELNEVVKTEPYKFRNNRLYGQMVEHFQALSSLCEELTSSLELFKNRMEEFHLLAIETSIEDEDTHLLVCEALVDCHKKIDEVESTLVLLNDCIRLREYHNSLLKTVSPHLRGKKAAYSSRINSAEAFKVGHNSVLCSQVTLMEVKHVMLNAQTLEFSSKMYD
ncbi:hypothetical protein D5018_20960 [Parashewanella curva]|uniref:Uncharacterized protein n=2 Tax=Parashewanella curva TaxID=2338552 RepID=A0A3L8PSF3_9GAMM|nr:hypothetical protein D5018_20960 [Parashewanella curva]